MNKVSKGLAFECQQSLQIHSRGVPILLSSLVLREFGCGQIDVALLERDQVKLYELKMNGHLSSQQWRRLQRTASLVAQYFERSVEIEFVQCAT